jgi:phosphopantothenoylcysteine decarboxylase/phosphopantothenate--cysteine ligase
MLEPEDIASALLVEPTWLAPRLLAGRRVVVTAGPTREAIDPVRYITNRSSGKMGYAVAVAAAESGAEVVLISGPVSIEAPPGIRRICIETAEELYRESLAAAEGADIFIGCAAVSDYRPPAPAAEKIKRSGEDFKLDLVRSPDTLAGVAAMRDAPFTVGFAAETEKLREHALKKLKAKKVDMIAANQVGPACGFDCETNALEVFWSDGSIAIDEDTKLVVARRLMALIAEKYRTAKRGGAVADSQAAS